MTQHELIVSYCKEFGNILPAKLYGQVYKGKMLGSELSKRCRELRKKGILKSERRGKFEVFWLTDKPDIINELHQIIEAHKAIEKVQTKVQTMVNQQSLF